MITDNRKITGDKYVITLPQAWRQAHGLSPSDHVTTMFGEGEASPMVVIPKGAELDELRRELIVALLDGPSVSGAKELSLRLGKLVSLLDDIAAVAA